MKTILSDLLICTTIVVAATLVPTLWHSAQSRPAASGERKTPNCGKLYFHVLDVDTSESGNTEAERLLSVYSMHMDARGDTLYTEVIPYALGEGWYIVDNCSPRKKIVMMRGDVGMEIVAEEMPSTLSRNVVIDSILIRHGIYALRFDERAARFDGEIPGQPCDDCIDMTPQDWARVRVPPTAVFR